MKFLAIINDGTCIILTGKQKISAGKQQNQGGETLYAQNVAGKRVFLVGHPSTLAGQCFSGVVTGGYLACSYPQQRLASKRSFSSSIPCTCRLLVGLCLSPFSRAMKMAKTHENGERHM